MPQDTANKNLCKHTQGAQTFLVTPTKGMEYIHGTATKMTVLIDNAQHPLIIDSGAHCPVVARNYSESHVPNRERQLCQPKQRTSKVLQGRSLPLVQLIKRKFSPIRRVISDSTQSL
ncbi:hypothetical protein O181_045125 [Austropuccinia psidii MF-1]|uniref:Uncharacterized protein n=1 Tax=Austropuccinia psidii MF-1 TaxID=1389203 RepID=A0A9Q3DL94_9BASI|nr:hypothetical protein [Austropuccinia psidii MF-1]